MRFEFEHFNREKTTLLVRLHGDLLQLQADREHVDETDEEDEKS